MVETFIITIMGVMLPTVIVMSIRTEHRLTRLETKMDSLLKKNGIEPQDCLPSKKKATE